MPLLLLSHPSLVLLLSIMIHPDQAQYLLSKTKTCLIVYASYAFYVEPIQSYVDKEDALSFQYRKLAKAECRNS